MLLCFGVVIIHLTASPLFRLAPNSAAHIFIFTINKILGFCVPAFIFLSGFKLFNKYAGQTVDKKRFYKGRFIKIVIPYFAAVAVYFLYFFAKGWASVKDLPQYIFWGTIAAHFYYIIIAVQCYIIFPFIKTAFEKCPKATVCLSFLCTILFSQFGTFSYCDRFFGTYIFYFVLGMAFAKYTPQKSYTAAIISATSAAVHLYLTYRQITAGQSYALYGTVNMIYVTSAIITIYIACRHIKSAAVISAANAVNTISFSVYLYHILVIFILQYDVYPHFALSVKEEFVISSTTVTLCIGIYAFLNHIKRK